jgi:hypothetical protein
MGQYDRSAGGDIYLVEDEAQVRSLEVRDPSAWPSSPRPPCPWTTRRG